MKTVQDVFDAAMGLMDELSATGEALTNDTKEYEYRTPGIINMMVSEYKIYDGTQRTGFIPVTSLTDNILKIPDTYAAGIMHYGLAANLLVDENPTAASFFEQRYEELRNIYFARLPADANSQTGTNGGPIEHGRTGGEIIDLYGGIEYGQFSRW